MRLFLSFLRFITAVLMPIGAALLSYLTLRQVQQAHEPGEMAIQTCLRCHQSRVGGKGVFAYTKRVNSPRQHIKKNEHTATPENILGTEEYFICDRCAYRYLRCEILLQILIVVPYPAYIYLILPFLFTNYLLEAFLAILSFAGAAAAWNLYRAVRRGDTPLAEARDRVAIQTRKKLLGDNFSYYTRTGLRHLKE